MRSPGSRVNTITATHWPWSYDRARSEIDTIARCEGDPDEPPDDELPPTVHEMQAGVDRMVSVIAYPERMLMSPATYLTYDHISREGPVAIDAIQDAWLMTPEEAEAVFRELADVYLWNKVDGKISLKPFRSDLFHGTGVMRACWELADAAPEPGR